jgi:hypothetical protein
MGRRNIDGPGVVGFIAAICAILVMAFFLWAVLPKKAQAHDVADDDMVLKRSALIELGTKYLQSLSDREVLLEALDRAQKEIHRLQSATNCS